MTRLYLPETFDEEPVIAFINDLLQHEDAPQIVFDFSTVKYAYPFGTLFLASELKAFFARRKFEGLSAEGIKLANDGLSYLAHMGFFKHIGIPIGNEPGQARGGLSYAPLKVLKLQDVRQQMDETGRMLGDIVQEESNLLAQVITQKRELKFNRPIAYCLREIIRNVFEHANTDRCAICAQKWFDGTVELAVVDQGRGVRKSLEEKHSFTSDFEALVYSTKPGMSRALPMATEDAWANSGFGLFVLSELGRKIGPFLLISGGTGLRADNGEIRQLHAQFHGTAVKLKIKPPKGINFEEFIHNIISEGEVLTGEGQGRRRASKSTRLV